MKFKILLSFLLLALVVGCSQSPSSNSSGLTTSSVSSSSSSSVIVENVNLTSSFYLAKGTDAGESGSTTNINGVNCVMVNATEVADGGNYALEAQWDLSQSINMSGENFIIDFDINISNII